MLYNNASGSTIASLVMKANHNRIYSIRYSSTCPHLHLVLRVVTLSHTIRSTSLCLKSLLSPVT